MDRKRKIFFIKTVFYLNDIQDYIAAFPKFGIYPGLKLSFIPEYCPALLIDLSTYPPYHLYPAPSTIPALATGVKNLSALPLAENILSGRTRTQAAALICSLLLRS
jgi:hypothetical protein